MLGLLVAKLLNIPAVGFYHTDFTLQAREINQEEPVAGILEWYTRWFYSSMDEIRVPSAEYVGLLANRGLDRRKLTVFRRGIDPQLFSPKASSSPDSAMPSTTSGFCSSRDPSPRNRPISGPPRCEKNST
jgi:glycosyltransferase involved in cell wall biosynthesis